MREKLKTLPLQTLREMAREQGLRVSGLRKDEVIDLLCSLAEKQEHQQEAEKEEKQDIKEARPQKLPEQAPDLSALDSGEKARGILEVMPEGNFGFIRCENFLPGENDVYVAPSQIRRFNMKTGDIVRGSRRVKTATEKFAALLYVTSINGYPPFAAERRPNFEDLTPIFPDQRLNLEVRGGKNTVAMRVMDLLEASTFKSALRQRETGSLL